jgi:peptidoglycan/xylan/chitin deacetylase (PgdA/CDA1 family)
VLTPDQRRYRPTAFLALSAALHVGGAASLALTPRLWPWVLAGTLLDHVALALAGCWPRSRLLGPNLSALDPATAEPGTVALTFDDGPDPECTPRVLDLLAAFGAQATFFCIGTRAQRHPHLVEEIARRGHGVENHSHTHSYAFACFGPRRLGRELDLAQGVLGELAGTPPRFFRAPAGVRNPLLEPLLLRRGLRLVSWTRRGFDATLRDPRRILRRLLKGLGVGDILVLHDGRLHRRGGDAPVLSVLPELLRELERRRLRSVALTPRNEFH